MITIAVLPAVLFVLHNTVVSSIPQGYSCYSSKFRYDTTCETNCSQGGMRIAGHETILNCTIGNKKDVDAFRLSHPSYVKPLFDAPKLKSVSHCDDASCHRQGLKIEFTLPQGLSDPLGQMPEAVFLTFRGVEDPVVRDDYYYHCSRERIFRFWNYEPKTTYDVLNPRTLSYDCFVGLDPLKLNLVYNITMETYQGNKADYFVTVQSRHDGVWRPVIATFHDNNTVHCVVEKTRGIYKRFGISSCQIQLVTAGNKVVRKYQSSECDSATFKNILKGKYTVKVVYSGPCRNNGRCPDTSSYRIEIKDVAVDNSASKENWFMSNGVKVVLAVAGSLSGVLVVVVAFLVKYKPRDKNLCGHSGSVAIEMQPQGPGITDGRTENDGIEEEETPMMQNSDETMNNRILRTIPKQITHDSDGEIADRQWGGKTDNAVQRAPYKMTRRVQECFKELQQINAESLGIDQNW